MLPPIQIDLDVTPAHRWDALSPYVDQAQRLTESYVRDLGGMGVFGDFVEEYASSQLAETHHAELLGVARLIGRPVGDVLLANLYYDAMKVVLMGCTAVAMDGPGGPIHARNLDWWTEERMLAEFTQITEVAGTSLPGPFRLIGWPGFIGAFSGVAPGRFAISLNAVVSAEPASMAAPVTFLIRQVFETCPNYEAAVRTLRDTPIACDAILMVTGTRAGEMAVVERTPTRAVVRGANDGVLVATNDYRVLDDGFVAVAIEGNELHQTTCARYDRARGLAADASEVTVERALGWLKDPGVAMGITVQHMAMQASTGALEVHIPTKS